MLVRDKRRREKESRGCGRGSICKLLSVDVRLRVGGVHLGGLGGWMDEWLVGEGDDWMG